MLNDIMILQTKCISCWFIISLLGALCYEWRREIMEYNKDDIIREFEFEHNRCQSYFDLMYKTLQFVFVAIVALVVGVFSSDDNPELQNLIMCLILPICMYVFGIMYAYNAYALAACGERAEILHSNIYKCTHNFELEKNKRLSEILPLYIICDRKITLIAYGIPLGFYLTVPVASYLVGMLFFPVYSNLFFEVCPIICLIFYYAIMILIIYSIAKRFFVKGIQEEPQSKK